MGTNLGDLLAKAGLKASEGAAEAAPEVPLPEEPGETFAAKVVVRYSRKGRGGKTVTLVSGVLALEPILGRLRKELGVGARADGDELVIQGNQVERVARWLESNGARQVVRG